MKEKLNKVSVDTIKDFKILNIKSETLDLDYKELFKISDTKGKIEFIKDLVAFANSKGGYLIYGVTNGFNWIGLDERSDTNCDEAVIGNIIDEYIDGDIDFISNIVEIDGESFIVIYIFPSKDIIPFKKDGQYNKAGWGNNQKQKNCCVFKKGDVYCRRNSRSIKADNLFFTQKRNNFKIIENVTSQATLYNEFIGRKGHLEELFQKVNNDNNRIIQIDGIGGIGKTTFVHYFCKLLIENHYKNDFEFIIWTSSKRNKYTPTGIKLISEFISNYEDLLNDIYKFIELHSLDEDSDEEIEIEDVIINFLSQNKVLLIVDNLETLNDTDLINFLENLPKASKAILTTRETLGDFYMARINLIGFKRDKEFPEFLDSQYKWFSGSDILFTNLYTAQLDQLYEYTKGMPLAGQLITHQVSQGTPISIILNNLINGKAYEEILSFCFKGSIDKLSEKEQVLLYIFSLSEKEDLLTIDDLIYICGYSDDDIGMEAIPRLCKISLCFSSQTDSGEIGYGIPHLAKIYTKQYTQLTNEKDIIEQYEKFIQERKIFNSESLGNMQLLARSNAKNHQERVIANKAMQALSIASYSYDAAMGIIEELISKNNRFAFLYLIKGKIEDGSFHTDSYERAKRAFLLAIEIDANFLEALIELGYLELKSRTGKQKNSREILDKSLSYFNKAENIDPENRRVHLGLAQVLAAVAKKINEKIYKAEKLSKAREANNHFEKAYYNDENITLTQIHSNAITSFGHAQNLKTVLRDYDKALEICKKGLSFEPENAKLLELKEDLLYRKDPENYAVNRFVSKGWIKP